MSLQLYPEGLHSMKWRRETLFLQRIRPWRWKLKADMTALHTHQGILEKKKKKRKDSTSSERQHCHKNN